MKKNKIFLREKKRFRSPDGPQLGVLLLDPPLRHHLPPRLALLAQRARLPEAGARTGERLAARLTQRSTARQGHSLAAQEEEVQPQPGEHQHDDGDGEAEDEPRAEVDHLGVGVATEQKKTGGEDV